MSGEKDNINNINNFFDNLTFYDKYQNDIWIAIIVILITVSISLYYLFFNYLKSQKNNYEEQKCNPLFMPFVSIIKNDTFDGKFVAENMKSCFNKLNFDVGLDLTSPIKFIMGLLRGIFYIIITLLLGILNFILYIFSMILKIILWIFQRFQLLLMESNIGFIGILEFTNKLLAMLTTIFYSLILAVDMIRYSFQIMALAVLGALVIPSIIAFVIALVATIVTYILAWIFKVLSGLFYALAAGFAASFFLAFLAPPLAAVGLAFSLLSLTMYGLFAGFLITMLISLALMIFFIILYTHFVNGTTTMLQAMDEVQEGTKLQ